MTNQSIGELIDSLINETVKSALAQRTLQEKEKQQAVASSQKTSGGSQSSGGGSQDLFGTGDSGDGSEGGEPAPSKTMDDESEKLKTGEVTVDDVVDKLNAIRSGRSFKDSRVSDAMDQYFQSLNKAEKTALLAFLRGIAQIVTGEVPGEQAMEPDAAPANVEMQKGDAQKMKHVEPNVIKASPPKQKPVQGAENTSGPVPITPKRK